ncbi:hypothetical protein K2173_020754 [Erythroxylum novogranatense]|uniref:Ribokinase n=1 Tax=Erythroxylum novogranatense TaxID=1862640 RepID=A0AAV8TNT7_9ROSI|nr:hypothetical protein K2173_020754 [Erythroxylum novogranatense]
MKTFTLSPANHCYLKTQISPRTKPLNTNLFQSSGHQYQKPSNKTRSIPFLTVQSAESSKSAVVENLNKPPLVVVGSANFDLFVEIDRPPKIGETVSAKTGQTLAGGKGANQAVCSGKLSYPTYFVGQVGEDAYGNLILDALKNGGVCVDNVRNVHGVPTGHAVVMLQSDGQNSIIIVGGANMSGWPERLSDEDLKIVKNAGIVLLQREIPDSVNIQVAKAAKSAGVMVILDAGGMDAPLPEELLNAVDMFSPNETELGRITGMPTEGYEQISQAALKCHKMGVKQVLVKLGSKGSALFVEGNNPINQPIIPAPRVVDTTGAGDTFTAAFAVALMEGKPIKDCMRFAAAAASLCIRVKGAIPGMPDRSSVVDLLHSI